MKMDSRAAFLAAAVEEAQSTIRAIDVKIGVLLVFALAPIALISSISICFSSVYKNWSGFFSGTLIAAICISWALTVLCYLLAVGAINNPARHVKDSDNHHGNFWGAGLYNFEFQDAMLNRASVKSKKDPLMHLESMPKNQEEILKELAFEHLKLIYIRDIKIFRMRWGYKFSGISITLGTVLYLFGRYYTNGCGP
jgi:hypothetical protein